MVFENLLTVIAPDAFVSPRAEIGAGCFVQRGAMIGRNAVIGFACKLNCGAALHHDVRLGDYTTITPVSHLLGGVRIGEGCYIGSSAVVLPRRTVGDGATVGAGAVVTHDVSAGAVVAGRPARRRPEPFMLPNSSNARPHQGADDPGIPPGIPMTDQTDPVLSIIMPVRNEGGSLSIMLKVLPPLIGTSFEILVVHDDLEDTAFRRPRAPAPTTRRSGWFTT